MNPKVITSTDLRVKTRDIIEGAKFNGQHYIVETFGKPMVAIIGIDEYYELTSSKVLDNRHIDTAEATDEQADTSYPGNRNEA
jgi:hypothetical protein